MSHIFVEDHVIPQIFTSAIEAYEILHKNPKGRSTDRLETFGLLWGYSIQAKGNQPAKIIVTMSTVETSATRHSAWVAPHFASLRMKKEFLESYWPNIEMVGSFHSHPYDSLNEANKIKGWQASPQDIQFFPDFHKQIAPEQENIAHLVVAITHLGKDFNSKPSRLGRNEAIKGYIISARMRRIWLRAYETKFDKTNYLFMDDSYLEIPSLQRRFTE